MMKKELLLTPEAVNLLVESDNEVIVQKGAGLGANYTDKDYSENGAIISDSPARVYSADVVIKVAPFSEKETEYLKGNQVVLSYLNVLKLSEETLGKLIRKKVTAIAFEKIRDNNGDMPVVESMSEIAGITSLLDCIRISQQYAWRKRSDAWWNYRCNSNRSYNIWVQILPVNMLPEQLSDLDQLLKFSIIHCPGSEDFRIFSDNDFRPQFFILRF